MSSDSYDDEEQALISVEVAYATPERQLILTLEVPRGTSAYEAVRLSKISDEFPAIDIDSDPMGIFSKVLDGKSMPGPRDYHLSPRDRVEIYRPLTIDPKQARLNRAAIAKSKAAKKGGAKGGAKGVGKGEAKGQGKGEEKDEGKSEARVEISGEGQGKRQNRRQARGKL